MKSYYYSFDTPIGILWVGFSNKGIVHVSFNNEAKRDLLGFLKKHFDDVVEYKEQEKDFSRQINAYLKGELKTFDIPVDLHGTDFQIKVWKELMKIPYGKTRTYKDIAHNIGNIKAVRAVGGANNKNPIPIVIPCHRVIGSDGNLLGYGGGIDYKVRLLELEGHNIMRKTVKGEVKYYLK